MKQSNNMNEELPKLQPVPILITSYNRKNLLERCIQLINDRTFYPFRIFVIDNNSTDGTQEYLKRAKVVGKIFDIINMPENVGQSRALNKGFFAVEEWENHEGDRMKRSFSDFLVTTNEDIYPPMLGQENCWLTQMIGILEKYEPEFGGLSMRFQRLPRTDIDETSEVIECYKGFNSVFRLMRRSDLRQLGPEPFGRLLKWNSNTTADKYKLQLKKKFGFATHIYADHAGFMIENKGFPEEVESLTVAENKVNEGQEKPYPDIDPLTNEPIKINHPCDTAEQKLRDDYKAKLEGKLQEPEVTVIVLTCNRYDGLKKIVDSVKNNTKDINYNLLVVADGDDTEAYNYCVENGIQCLLSNVNRDFTAQANLGIYACQTPYFFLLADDMEILQPDWLSKSLKTFKERFPDNIGIMTVDEGLQHGRIFTTGMSSKKFVHFAGGNFFYPRYVHFGGDNDVSAWTKHLNLYHYEESIKVNHFHPSHKVEALVAKDDETYHGSLAYMHQDQALKKQRKSDLDKLAQDKNYYDYL